MKDGHNKSKSVQTRKWGKRAAALLRIEKDQLWRPKYSSISEFIIKHAEDLGEHPQTLWRELSAGRYYNELGDALGRDFPKLDEPGLRASAESLEITRKISRVAPIEVAQAIQCQAMEGTLSRRKLLQMWQTYRPVLDGRTARGRKVVAPCFDPNDEFMVRAQDEANRLVRFFEQGPSWLRVERTYLYKVIYIAPTPAVKQLSPPAPDVVILLCRKEGDPLEVHGVKAVNEEVSNDLGQYILEYNLKGANVDFLWLAYPTKVSAREKKSIPAEFGLIVSTPGTEIQSIREAQPARREPIATSEKLVRIALEQTNRN